MIGCEAEGIACIPWSTAVDGKCRCGQACVSPHPSTCPCVACCVLRACCTLCVLCVPRRYVPDMPEEFYRMPYDQVKSDIIRAATIYHHGGLYVTALSLPLATQDGGCHSLVFGSATLCSGSSGSSCSAFLNTERVSATAALSLKQLRCIVRRAACGLCGVAWCGVACYNFLSSHPILPCLARYMDTDFLVLKPLGNPMH